MGRKVIRSKIMGRCKKCGMTFELNKSYITMMEIDTGSEPFGARAAVGDFHCHDCGHLEITPYYEYERKYRVRCKKCHQMFDADFSNASRCPKCDHEHLIALSKLGV